MATCRAWPFWHEVGEWVAIGLGAVFITPEAVSFIYRKLGLIEISASCSCELHKQWLNTFGGRLANSPHWLARWLTSRLVRRADKP